MRHASKYTPHQGKQERIRRKIGGWATLRNPHGDWSRAYAALLHVGFPVALSAVGMSKREALRMLGIGQ